MDDELIERLAHEAGLLAPESAQFAIPSLHSDGLERFAALVAEECAKTADAAAAGHARHKGDWCDEAEAMGCEEVARAIREKFKAQT